VNVIGERLTVLASPDRTKKGRTGRVVLETAKTLVIDTGGRMLRIEKSGSSFMLLDKGMTITGSDIAGRLQDRLGRRAS
jgi:RNase P/RNase MRP subunit p29